MPFLHCIVSRVGQNFTIHKISRILPEILGIEPICYFCTLHFTFFLIVFSDWHFHTRKFRHSLSVNFVSLLGPSGKLWMVQKNHLLREK